MSYLLGSATWTEGHEAPMPATAPAAYTQLRVRVKGRAFVSTLFARAHVSRADDAELPAGRTLFLLNVTPHIAPASLAAAFEARAGEVTSIRMGEGVGAHSAHVIFAKPAIPDWGAFDVHLNLLRGNTPAAW